SLRPRRQGHDDGRELVRLPRRRGGAGMTHSGPRTGTTLTAVTEAGRKAALIGYLPIGLPSVPGSIEAMLQLVRSGVDIVEVGVHNSQLSMDERVIQRAAEAAR